MLATPDNRVQLIGFLGNDIEVRELGEGKKLARLSMATHEYRKDENGHGESITTWHNLVAWGKTAEIMSRIFRKGQRLYVEGKLTYREYTTKDDVKRNSTEIVVSEFRKLEPADKD
jgi:single-strand DNA-binding protein